MTASVFAIIVIIINSFFNAIGQLFFKKGADQIKSIKTLIANKFIWLGIIIYALCTVVFVGALRYGELSTLYPFVATNYIWVSLFAQKYLNEKMNLIKWLGILLILIGVFSISLGL
ncbi:MAG TPA: EamA family transporter [Bacteroidia bacterium]|nr:EamA family transporter [Bacteroidia bacterium]